MIVLLGASSIVLAALQASINAPRDAFRVCLRDAVEKASNEKVGGEAIEDYLRKSCSVQLGGLKSALVAFDMKNGMSRKSAADDAEMTAADYLASPVEKYQFMSTLNAPAPATAAAGTTQPPK
jgi:hypothetical protein